MKSDYGSYILIILLGLFLFFLQTSVFNPVPGLNIPVNFLVVLSICFSGFAGLGQRVAITLYCGLLIDLWFSSCSFYTLSLLIVNNLVSFVALQTQVNTFFIIIATALGTMLIELINAAFLGFCLYNTPFNPLLIYQQNILKLVLGNALFALLIFSALKKQFTVKSGFGRF